MDLSSVEEDDEEHYVVLEIEGISDPAALMKESTDYTLEVGVLHTRLFFAHRCVLTSDAAGL